MKFISPTKGSLDLTYVILKRTFGEDRCKKLMVEHLEYFSNTVLRHLVSLSAQERNMLTQLFGIGCEPMPLGIIRAEHDWTAKQAQKYVDKAFQDLIDAAKSDLHMTMYDIEYSDKEQS